ncbi:MAG: O-antigen ligase family protein [Lewinellaceae bacterium]|nr:O-antigen ligase family protein [Lewinellaceae bacterium]
MKYHLAAYIVGMEVWLRMTKAALPWEYGKIAAIFLLLLGIAVEGRFFRKPIFIFLIFLLLPSLLFVEGVNFDQFRQFLTFQLGGLILLSISGIYFFHRPLALPQFQQLLIYFIGPILITLIQITLRSPSTKDIDFQLMANFAASGGFGFNQVSSIIGLGIACLALNFLLRFPPFFTRWIDIGLFGLFSLRILLTFSRGGMATAFLSVGLSYFIYLSDRGYSMRKIMLPALLGILLITSFFVVNNITQGALLDRYEGETYATKHGFEEVSFAKATSGRFEIVLTDFAMWHDHPLFGVGVGISNVLRPDYGVNNISHTEQTRLLSEHGLLGLFVLLIIIFAFLRDYFKRRGAQRAILVLFFLLSFLTMFHSATRLALTGFVYGIGFIVLIPPIEKLALRRQPPVPARHHAHHD